jgi:hypothetical protein
VARPEGLIGRLRGRLGDGTTPSGGPDPAREVAAEARCGRGRVILLTAGALSDWERNRCCGKMGSVVIRTPARMTRLFASADR